MLKAKRRVVPNIPADFAEFDRSLQGYQAMNEFYKGSVTANNDARALIFLKDSMIEPLSNCTELFVDGTFKVLPRRPAMSQILVIHFRKQLTGFAAVHVLCNARTSALYNAIWNKLFELIPNLKNNIQSIFMDFEAALIRSAKESFLDGTRICGCFFHFCQALTKKWSKNRIPEEYKVILKKCMALPFLPPNKIRDGYDNILREADEMNRHDGLDRFMLYVRRYWLRLIDIFSVWNRPTRTNNLCENYNKRLVDEITHHPDLWKFLARLQRRTDIICKEYEQVKDGRRLKRQRSRAAAHMDREIKKAQESLELDGLSVEDFLQRIVFVRNVSVDDTIIEIPDDDHENDDAEMAYVQENVVADPGNGGGFENGIENEVREEEEVIGGGRQRNRRIVSDDSDDLDERASESSSIASPVLSAAEEDGHFQSDIIMQEENNVDELVPAAPESDVHDVHIENEVPSANDINDTLPVQHSTCATAEGLGPSTNSAEAMCDNNNRNQI